MVTADSCAAVRWRQAGTSGLGPEGRSLYRSARAAATGTSSWTPNDNW